MLLGILLLIFIVQIYGGIKSSSLLQEGLARVQEDGRIALNLVANEVRKAGFRKPVWNDPLNGYHPVTANSVNGASGANDTLQIMYFDARSCTGILNTTIDGETGEPQALYKRVTFTVDVNENLQWSCDYGASPAALANQISNQTIIDGVESFQVMYGVDTDLPTDFSVNSWARADQISPQTSICLQSQNICEVEGLTAFITTGVPVSLQIGLLVRSPEGVGADNDGQSFNVLDVAVPAANDKSLRKLYTTTITLRNLTI